MTAGILRPPVTPSLVSLGLTFGSIDVRTAPIAATRSQLIVPVAAKGAKKIPDGTRVGIRWDPIMLDAKPASSASGSSPPAASPSPSASVSPSGTVAPSATPAPIDAPDVDLVVPEQLGSVVTLAPAARTGKGLNVGVTYPSAPGLYRLVLTLHDATGVAYDAPTQSELRSVIVHVGGLYSAAFGAPSSITLGTGASSTVGVRVVNAGSEGWDVETPTPPSEPDSLLIWLRTQRTAARVVATWVSPQDLPVPASVSAAIDPRAAAPGGTTAVGLKVVAPAQAGDYLLLLDVVTPNHGALSTQGSTPALIRVAVTGPTIAPSQAPAPSASTAP
jgi:hypothetical protein